MTTGTVTFHRILRCPPERVFKAFTTPAAMCKWLPPHGFAGEVHHMDARAGGSWRMSFIHLASGKVHSFGGGYLVFEPGRRLAYTARFDEAMGLPGEMTTAVDLATVSCGTEMRVQQSGIPSQIPTEICCLGWQESLALLTLLVEADIPA
ncbi:MAG: SRPBCC domain-containing protein [Burkholderiales bacterium]|nr:SRPBCC domain-containing protein [Burkholderiales bacterium]